MHCPKIEVTGSWPGWKKKTNTSLLEWGINLPRLSKYPKKWVLNSYLLHHWFQYTSTHTFAWLYSWACGRDLVQRPGAWNIPYIYIPISHLAAHRPAPWLHAKQTSLHPCRHTVSKPWKHLAASPSSNCLHQPLYTYYIYTYKCYKYDYLYIYKYIIEVYIYMQTY